MENKALRYERNIVWGSPSGRGMRGELRSDIRAQSAVGGTGLRGPGPRQGAFDLSGCPLPTKKPEAPFLLTVLPMGGILYGYFTGPRDTGERLYAAWVLARRKEDIGKGRNLIGIQTLPLRKGTG